MDKDTETEEQFSQKFKAYHNLQAALRKGVEKQSKDWAAIFNADEHSALHEKMRQMSKSADVSSFVEEGAPDSFADLDAKLKALEEKTKAELAKLQSDTAAPSSFVEEGAPDSFADLDAKLKALEEKTKAELAKLQSDTAAPSSFVEEGEPENPGRELLHLIHDGGAQAIKDSAAQAESHFTKLKETTSQDLATRHMAFVEGLHSIAEPLKAKLGKHIAEEEAERQHTEEELR